MQNEPEIPNLLSLKRENKAEIKDMLRRELDSGNTINISALAKLHGRNWGTINHWITEIRQERLATTSLPATVNPMPQIHCASAAVGPWGGSATPEQPAVPAETRRPPCPPDFSQFTLVAAAASKGSSQLHRARPPPPTILPARPVSARPSLRLRLGQFYQDRRELIKHALYLCSDSPCMIPAGPSYTIFSCRYRGTCCSGCCRRRPSLPGVLHLAHDLIFVTVAVALQSVSRCNQ